MRYQILYEESGGEGLPQVEKEGVLQALPHAGNKVNIAAGTYGTFQPSVVALRARAVPQEKLVSIRGYVPQSWVVTRLWAAEGGALHLVLHSV